MADLFLDLITPSILLARFSCWVRQLPILWVLVSILVERSSLAWAFACSIWSCFFVSVLASVTELARFDSMEAIFLSISETSTFVAMLVVIVVTF